MLGQAEVQYNHAPFRRHFDVGRLQIAMQNTGRVQCRYGLCKLPEY